MTQPLVRTEYLDHLGTLSPNSDGVPDPWTDVHEQIQLQLAVLEKEVRGKAPGVRVDSGRTRGDSFFLFSYRTFSMPHNAVDPVVVGMTFTPVEQGVGVEGDVSGEQTGDVILSVPSETVAASREHLVAAARTMAEGLCRSAEAIVAALEDPSRRVE
jgi:hypothetical protein